MTLGEHRVSGALLYGGEWQRAKCKARFCICILALPKCVNWSKLLNFFMPHFSYLQTWWVILIKPEL